MPVDKVSSNPIVRAKATTSAPHEAVIGVAPVRHGASHSNRHLSLTDPEIHRAMLRSFHLSRRLDKQASLPSLSTAEAGASTEAQPSSSSPATTAAAATAAAAAADADDKSDILDIFGSNESLSIGSSDDSWRHKIYDEYRLTGCLLRAVDSMLTASLRSKLSLQMFRSHLSIRKEQRRQIETNRFIIHPFSDFRTVWSLFMVLALGVTVISLPIEIAFYSTVQFPGEFDITFGEIYYSRFMAIAAGTIFLVDVIINFRTGYVLKETDEMLWLQSKAIELFNVVAMIFILAHWNGCLQYTFCYIEHYPNFPPESWIYRDGLHLNNVTTTRRYTRSLFRALSHMLAVGYGQGPPTTTSETWVVMVSMLTGITLYAMFVAYMARLVASLDYSGHKYDAMVSELKEFMRFHKVPLRLQHRVLNFYEHKYRRKFFDEDKFLKHSIVSPPLRKEIAMHSCRHLVRNVTFFKDASTDFIYQIVSRLVFQVYFPREIIIHAGHMTEGMYFIEHGRVEARLPSGEVLERISEGGYFGELSLVFGDKQEANVIAIDMCDIYCLSKHGFDEVLADYPEIKNSISALAIIRKRRHKSKGADFFSSPGAFADI